MGNINNLDGTFREVREGVPDAEIHADASAIAIPLRRARFALRANDDVNSVVHVELSTNGTFVGHQSVGAYVIEIAGNWQYGARDNQLQLRGRVQDSLDLYLALTFELSGDIVYALSAEGVTYRVVME